MPIPAIAAIGGLASKAALGAKGIWAGGGAFGKLMMLLFGYDIAKDTLGFTGEKLGIIGSERGIKEKQLELAGKQMGMQTSMGKREEARADKLMNQLLQEKGRERRQSSRESTRKDIRSSQDQQNQMAMTMLMALAEMQNAQSRTASRPSQSTMSMMSLMR